MAQPTDLHKVASLIRRLLEDSESDYMRSKAGYFNPQLVETYRVRYQAMKEAYNEVESVIWKDYAIDTLVDAIADDVQSRS